MRTAFAAALGCGYCGDVLRTAFDAALGCGHIIVVTPRCAMRTAFAAALGCGHLCGDILRTVFAAAVGCGHHRGDALRAASPPLPSAADIIVATPCAPPPRRYSRLRPSWHHRRDALR